MKDYGDQKLQLRMTTTYNYNASKSSCADTSWMTASKLPEHMKDLIHILKTTEVFERL